jgi:hypothetical protein
MTIFTELMQRVDSGETFQIDFQKRNMKVGKTYLIKNGEYDTERSLGFGWHESEILRMIEELYTNYKYSLPSERNDGKRTKYFKALSISEMTDRQLMVANRREGAQARLEGFILCAIVNGTFKWTESMGKWFWQSKNDPDLVILRSWIENN